MANTGNDTVVRIPVAGAPLTPGTPEVFVNSINGADGLIIDEDDNIWVAANQADELVVIEPTDGRVIAKLGDFNGVGKDGAPNGFLFPASLVFHGNDVFVTNLSLNLATALGNPAARTVDSAWADQVTTHTTPKACIIASDSSSRPGRLAVENSIFENSDGPKLPKMKARSNACAAP